MSRFTEWYERNKHWFNVERADKRQKKAVRQQVNEQNAKARNRRKEKETAERQEEAKHKMFPKGPSFREEMVEDTPCVTIGALSLVTGLSVQVLRRREGVEGSGVPEPYIYSNNGERLYSIDQIEEAARCFKGSVVQEQSSPRTALLHAGGDAPTMYRAKVWLVSEAARCVGKTVRAFLAAEGRGTYPVTPLRTKMQSGELFRRLYTKPQLEVLLKSVKKFPGAHGTEERANWILEEWAKVGYGSKARFIRYDDASE